MTKKIIVWSMAAVLLVCAVLAAGYGLSQLQIPAEDTTIGRLEYWLNRYQTLISGVLAILGAAAAIYGAKMSIWHDRAKINDEQEAKSHRAVQIVLKILFYTKKMVITKESLLNRPPEQVAVIGQYGRLDAGPLERVAIEHIDRLPIEVGTRVLYVVYCMKFTEGFKLNSDPKNKKSNMPLVMHLRSILVACDILGMQLLALLKMPVSMWESGGWEKIPRKYIEERCKERGLPPESASQLAKEMIFTMTD